MKKMKIIVNRTAGGGRAKKRWITVEKLMKSIGISDYEVAFTEEEGHGIELAEEAARENELVVAAGGDGTSNEVINGIIRSKQPNISFSIIPIGTGNDVATGLEIPQEISEACKLLNEETTVKKDLGLAVEVGRYFAGVASLGFDAQIAEDMLKGSKWLPGTWNYVTAMIKTLRKFKPLPVEVVVDGKPSEDHSVPTMLIAIGNGPVYGGGMQICPEASADDGKFTCTTLHSIGRLTLLRVFPKVYSGKHLEHSRVFSFEGREIRIKSDVEPLYQVDGELLGRIPVTFRTIPEGIVVLHRPDSHQDESRS